MKQDSNTGGERPLTARSVVASVLLGTQPPELAGRLLVRAGELFGLAEGTVRVAMSRMVGAGELETTGQGRYRLAGHLLERQARQDQSRRPPTLRWTGDWTTAVVTTDGRSPADRAALRHAMAARRMAELREGVWLRPDNLGPATAGDGLPERHCAWFTSRPLAVDAETLTHSLWDLDGWSRHTEALLRRMDRSVGSLRSGDTGALGPCFVTAATALRHLTSDPVLPAELLPGGWNGNDLRATYDEYEAALQSLLKSWFRTQE